MAPKAVHLDVCLYGADLRLRLTTPTSETAYLVSSHQLCNNSPVFRNLVAQARHVLSQNEYRPQGTKVFPELLLTGSHPIAFGIVLYVLHARPDQLPESVSFETLLEVAAVCEEYRCAAAMRPWDELWIRPWRKHALDPGYENWFFIAWVFGDQYVFRKLSKELIKNGVLKSGSIGLVIRGYTSEVELDHRISRSIIDAIITQKATVTDGLMRICASLYSKYEDTNAETRHCKHRSELLDAQACDNMRFGALHKGFKQLGILPPPGSHFENITLCELLEKLRSVDDYLKPVHKSEHCECNPFPELWKRVEKVVDDILPLQLSEFHRDAGVGTGCTRWMEALREQQSKVL